MSAKMKVRFTPKALTDIQRVTFWYEEQRKGLGSAFMLSSEAALATVQRNPEIYAKVEGDTRRVVMKHYPYGIFYSVEPEGIIVIAVFHSSRNTANR